MLWRNNVTGYGAVSITIHWLSVVLILILFGLGLWMVDLAYYHLWYHRAPAIHKALGVLLFVLTIARLGWRITNPSPQAIATHTHIERKAAHAVHHILYLLLFTTMLAGYLLSTADGRPLTVFDWFSIPAVVSNLPHQEDIAGTVHKILAWSLIGMVLLHAGAALKHHFIDRDKTLLRIFGKH